MSNPFELRFKLLEMAQNYMNEQSFRGVSKLVDPKAIPGMFAVCTVNSTSGSLVILNLNWIGLA